MSKRTKRGSTASRARIQMTPEQKEARKQRSKHLQEFKEWKRAIKKMIDEGSTAKVRADGEAIFFLPSELVKLVWNVTIKERVNLAKQEHPDDPEKAAESAVEKLYDEVERAASKVLKAEGIEVDRGDPSPLSLADKIQAERNKDKTYLEGGNNPRFVVREKDGDGVLFGPATQAGCEEHLTTIPPHLQGEFELVELDEKAEMVTLRDEGTVRVGVGLEEIKLSLEQPELIAEVAAKRMGKGYGFVECEHDCLSFAWTGEHLEAIGADKDREVFYQYGGHHPSCPNYPANKGEQTINEIIPDGGRLTEEQGEKFVESMLNAPAEEPDPQPFTESPERGPESPEEVQGVSADLPTPQNPSTVLPVNPQTDEEDPAEE